MPLSKLKATSFWVLFCATAGKTGLSSSLDPGMLPQEQVTFLFHLISTADTPTTNAPDKPANL